MVLGKKLTGPRSSRKEPLQVKMLACGGGAKTME